MADDAPLNAFCVDVEEWFHSFGFRTPYADPRTWDDAPSCVVATTENLMRLLDEAGVRGTFLTLGWIARKHPDLVTRLAREGHEVGCHGYWHRLVYELTPEQFEDDLRDALGLLRSLSGQPVAIHRAPSFSVTADALWCYPILRRHGVHTDVSIVPASRDCGGIAGLPRESFVIETGAGDVACFPMSVMTLFGRRVQFSGGGYLRLFPLSLVKAGFRENHAAGRPAQSYIHPREIDPGQPRLPRPPLWDVAGNLKYLKYYVNMASTRPKLAALLRAFRFGTVGQVLERHPPAVRIPLAEIAGASRGGTGAAVPRGRT
jgi:polysaccharide deacetylase family protein (PEP-CTERM system associated)